MSRTRVLLFFLFAFALAACLGPGEERIDNARVTTQSIAKAINNDFRAIRREVTSLVEVIRTAYLEKDEILPAIRKTDYRLADNGVFYKSVSDGRAALFVSGYTPIDSGVMEEAYFTEAIDTELERICRRLSIVAQAYYNSHNNLNRIYPPFDVLSQYEPRMHITGFDFYTRAGERHNPKKGPVWVGDPYVDPSGRGWIISVIAPVYVEGRMVGVPGLDVTVSTLTERYITPQKEKFMLVDSGGVVVTGHEDFISLFSLPPIIEHKYLTTIKRDTYRLDDYSLLKSRSKVVRTLAQELLGQISDRKKITIQEKNYTVLAVRIPELGWTLLHLVE